MKLRSLPYGRHVFPTDTVTPSVTLVRYYLSNTYSDLCAITTRVNWGSDGTWIHKDALLGLA